MSGVIPPSSHICLDFLHMDKALTSRVETAEKKNPLLKEAERPSAAEANQTTSVGSSSNTDHDRLQHGPPTCFVGRTSQNNSTWHT